jgi:hypothetical protein
MSKRSYFWHQAQVCMSLARVCNDPVLKERYEDLALDFAQNAGREQDLDDASSSFCGVKISDPGGDDTNPHE